MAAEFEYHVLKLLRVDLGAGELETLLPGHVLTEDDVATWGRSVDALIDQGKLARLPKKYEDVAELTDEQLLAELEDRGLHTATIEERPDVVEVPDGARVFTSGDADEIVEHGVAAIRRPNPVHLLHQEEPFAVETNEGTMLGEAGGFVAHDPISGHVWPVSFDYVDAHYDPVMETGDAEADVEEATPDGLDDLSDEELGAKVAERYPDYSAEKIAAAVTGMRDAVIADLRRNTPPAETVEDGLQELKQPELLAIAEQEGIELPADARSNAAKVEAIRAARAAKAQTEAATE